MSEITDLHQPSPVLAIDPGPVRSAYVLWNPGVQYPLVTASEAENCDVLAVLDMYRGHMTRCVVEMVACYGMAVGAETFDTCRWIGRFQERWSHAQTFRLAYRKDIKMHLCHSMRAKDANIRQALIDKYGPVGTKKNQGNLYGISGHLWAALAVADYATADDITLPEIK